MTFDPTAPTAEDIAFGAMLTLESPPADLPPEQVDMVRGTLESYAADRRGKGLPLFPNRTQQANSARADYLQKLYTQPLDKSLPAEAVARLEQRKAIHPDPEEFEAREVNRAFLSAVAQRNLTAADYDLTRDSYAAQELKLTGPITDKAVYGAIQNRFKEDESTRAATSAKITEVIQRQLATIGVEGESTQNTATTTAGGRKNLYQPPTKEERDAFLQTVPERSRAAVREQWDSHTREISRLFRQHAPLVEEITRGVELVKASDDPEKTIWKSLAGWTAKLPSATRERGVVLAMISNTLANNPNIDRGFLARLTSGMARGVNNAAVDILQATQAESRQVLRGAGASTAATEFTSDENTEFLTRARELAGVVQGSGMDLHAATDNFLQSSAIAAAPSAWMIPAAFHPVGQVAIQQTLMGSSIQQAATTSPDVPEGLRTNAAFASGAVQAALETLSNTIGVKIMLGKLPRFAGLLNKFGVQSPAGRAALGFVAGAATTGGIEYTEEALQGATDLMFQSLAADLAGQKPDVDWGGYFKEWATAAGPEQKETLLAVSAFGMIAGAGASFNHFKYGAALARNKTFLRAHGFTEAEVRDITNTTDLDEASRKAAAAFEEAQRRGPTLTEDEKARLETERKAAIEILKARNEAIGKTGTPVVTPETNTFTEETEWIFSDPVTGMQSRHDSEESAFIAWRDWSRTQDETALDTLREIAESNQVEFLTAEGQAGENVKVKESRTKDPSPADFQAEALAEQKTAEQDLRKATTPAQTRAAREKREAATGRLAGLKARLDVLLFDEGLTPAQAGDVFRTAVIKARTFSTNVMGRLAGFTVELFRGANLQDITEEFAEANMRNAVEQGFADPEIILDDIRRYESATGARIIDPAYQYDPANQIPLIEGFSKLARGVLLSERSSAALPPTVAKWIGIQLAMESASIELARDLGTAAEFREALQAGYVPPRLERQLRDSIGLDPAAQQRRLEKKMEEQLAAEAMGGFPEISDELRGKLPHPETLRAEGHPLVGEVRRIWESLKKSTKRRSKDGRVIDRTNEANAYFLPIGTMEDIDRVRESMNQRGFDFENPTDMLDALDASISYGKPFYGTASMGGESFSMSMGSNERLDASGNPQDIDTNTPGGANIGDAAQPEMPRDAFGNPEPKASISGYGFNWGKNRGNAWFTIDSATDWRGRFKTQVVGDSKEDVQKAFSDVLKMAEDDGYEVVSIGQSLDGTPSAKLLHKKAAEERNKLETLRDKRINDLKNRVAKEGIPTFLRYGKPPESGKSWNGKDQYYEAGVSVYPASKIKGNTYVINLEGMDKISSMFIREQKIGDVFEVTGAEVVGKGADGEPLLKGGTYRKISKSAKIADLSSFKQSSPASSGESFAVGRSTITPTAETRIFQGAEGSPTVIGPASYAISAFHGTPHKVDKFTTARMGTGEGAQAYGWGLYFAGALEVANSYRKSLGRIIARFRGQEYTPISAQNFRDAVLETIPKDWPAAIKRKLDPILDDIWQSIAGAALRPDVSTAFSEGKRQIEEYLDSNNVSEQAKTDVIKWLDGVAATIEPVNTGEGGNLYTVTLKVDDEDLLDWDKPLSEQSEKIRAIVDELTDNMGQTGRDFYKAMGVFESISAESDQLTSLEFLDFGIRGIRYLDGNSRSSGQGSYNYVIFDDADIEIVEENGIPVSMESFALSTRSVLRLEEAIAKRMTQGPDERLAFFNRLRDRLAATVLQLRESKRNVVTDATEAERERNRIQDALAEMNTVLQALPQEVRGRVGFNPAEVMDATTERGQVNAMLRLIDRADEALEIVLSKSYDEAFETLLDLAKPDLRQNKSIRGRLTPETQRLIAKVLEAVVLDPSQHAAALAAKEQEIATLEAATPQTPEEIAAAQQAVITAQIELSLLNTFGNFSMQTASEKANAYDELLSIYTRGRTIRRVLDEARREEVKDATREVIDSLPPVDQPKHAARTADTGLADSVAAWTMGFSSFHQVMEWLFPKSITARDLQYRVRAADRAFTRARIEAKERFDAFSFGVWNLTGVSRTRRRNQILADLSKRRDWNISLQEGVKFERVKLTEDQAAAILAGTMETGWETDPIALTSLRQALSDFRMMRLKAQNEEKAFRKTVIEFQRLTNRGQPGGFLASDLEALYLLQLYAQEQYRPALDKYGFTESVMEAMERQLNPKAQDLGDFLRKEYDAEWNRLNPVYSRLYGLDMPKIRNYAPGIFDHLDGKSGDQAALDTYGAPAQVNAMSAGFTKARTHHMARPKTVNALAGFWSHIEATEYFIAYAELVRDARQIFRNPEVRRRLEGNYGMRAANLFGQWLDALEVDGNFRSTDILVMSEMYSKTLATQAASGLAFNVGVLLKQIPAAFGFILEMPIKDAVQGMALAFRNPSAFKSVWSSEAVQQRILQGISPEDRKLIDASKASPSIIMDLLQVGRLPIAYADAAFTTLSGSVAYAYHKSAATAAGLSPTDAENSALAAASRVIERTAQPATTQDKSMAELTAKSYSKVLFMFRSDPRQKLAIVANAFRDVQTGKKGAKGTLAKKTLFGWLLYGLANEVLSDVWQSISRDDDDPERWAWQDYLVAMLVGPFSAVPVIGQVYEFTLRSTIGTKAFGSSENPADQILRAYASTRKLVAEIADPEASDWSVNDWLTTTQQLSSAIAAVAGIFDPRAAILPAATRVARDAQGMAANVLPETDEEKRLAVIREIQETSKPTREAAAADRKATVARIAKMDPTGRAAELARLEPAERRAVVAKLKMAEMSLSEQALAKLPKEQRAAAIEKITAGMGETEAAAYLERLKSIGLTE